MAKGQRGFLSRLYRGETRADFIGSRKKWYLVSGILLLICIGSIIFKGFEYGIEFVGGSQFVVNSQTGSPEDARAALEGKGIHVASSQVASGQGNTRKLVVKTGPLKPDEVTAGKEALTAKLGVTEINASSVSSSWGRDVTTQALIGLAVFLALVSVYLGIRFEPMMAGAALLALVNDILFTAGIYSLVGFEVTPGTVVGFLTILGFSLYDTVVVFDKVDENTKGILGRSQQTYAEAANLAVNQTLMRSINTSLIALLPVAGLLFIGAGLLGVGTLKDLALVLFFGIMTGAYSSMFLATPWLVDFKLMNKKYRAHTERVLARRASGDNKAAKRGRRSDDTDASDAADESADAEDGPVDTVAAGAPRPGARPAQRKRAGAKAGGSKGGRPGTKRRR